MAGSWKRATVAALQEAGVLHVEDGNHGENRPRPEEFNSFGEHFIRAADMEDGRVVFGQASRINEVARRRVRKGIGARGDVLLSHKGTVGKVALVPEDAPPFVCSPQTTFWRSLDVDQLDRRYLWAFLMSPGFHTQLASRAGETDMAPYVSLTSQRGLVVILPPIDEQRAIAHILGTLDDKIELNRRMNETLEEMARALFKSWFVDFDAVRRKAEGRDPGLPKHLADLFPPRFVDSELGEIPEGWRPAKLGNIVEMKRGYDLPTNDRRQGTVPIYSSSGPSGLHDQAMARAPGIVTGRYGTIGQVFLVDRDFWPLNTALYASDFKGHDPIYVYHALRLVDFAKYSDKGAVPGINRNHLHEEPLVAPSPEVENSFVQAVRPFLDRTVSLTAETQTLAALRDALLPKLISGELRIEGAERFIARAGL